MSVVIPLDPAAFGPRRMLAEAPGITVDAFRYRSGVQALTITTPVLSLDVLPFMGQQIWRARAYGRDLTMQSTFDEPIDTNDYLANYGAYFIHCGGSAMGNPGPEDAHPLHGELPSIGMDEASLELGEGWLELRGSVTYRRAFGAYFRARLELRVEADSAVMQSTATITNASAEPRPLMYLAHINARPAVGGHLEEALVPGASIASRAGFRLVEGDDVREISTEDMDAGVVPFEHLLARGVRVEPELVQTIPSAVEDGWSTIRQVHSDGGIDVVSFRRDHLTHTLRWLHRTADDDAHGFALPATAEADGFAAESRKGHVRYYAPGDSLVAVIRHGAEPPRSGADAEPTERTLP